VVVVTRDRAKTLLHTLERLRALPGPPPVVVVDNGSRDGTPRAVRERFGEAVHVVEAGRNLAAAARTVGARTIGTPLVAFADDDSWWAPGALERITQAFVAHPSLGLVAARVLVEPGGELDPTCEAMRHSPLPANGFPGPRVLGFVACGAVVRRESFLAAGGFDERLGIMAEETLLAIDLRRAGWELCYLDDAVAHHEPGRASGRDGRAALQLRNELWTAWLRRPLRRALAATAGVAARAPRDETARWALAETLRGAAWVARDRRPVPRSLERDLRALES